MSALKIPVTPSDHSQGEADSILTLVEYGDYECSYCGMAYPIVKQVQARFKAKLRFVFRNFPLKQAHPEAEAAAETAEFAGAHGKFWQMHDLLYENQQNLRPALYETLAEGLDLSGGLLRAALQSGTYRQRVHDDFMGGVHSGVNGTPTFYINGTRHDGSFEFVALIAALEAASET